MTEAERFLNGCQGRGRMTLVDHLTLAGYTESPAKRRQVTVQINKLLLTPTYKHLVGTTITHDQDAKGIRPAWAKDAPTQKNKVERPTGTAVTKAPAFISAMALIKNEDSKAELERVISRQSTSAARTITTAMEAIANEGRVAHLEANLTREALAESRANSESLRRAINALTDGVGNGKAVATA